VDQKERETGRRSPGKLAAYAVAQVLVALVGGATLVVALGWRDASTAVYGAFMLGFGLVSLLATTLEAVHGRRTHGAVTGTSPDGLPATVLPRAGWAPMVSGAFLVVGGGSFVAAGFVSLAAGDTLWGVFWLALGAATLGLLVPLLLGHVHAGGVYLTADGVTSVKDGAWWRVTWDDVAGAVPGEPLAVVLSDGARPDRGRSAPSFWRSEVRSPEGVLAVQTRYLSEDAATLAFLLLAYRDRPDLRAMLGTQASLDWEILRAGS
jgi:hypothetical protein